MRKRVVSLRSGKPILDIASFGRRGPAGAPPSPGAVQTAARTVRRVPEVVVKVSGGARTVHGVSRHVDYISREGEGELETDDGQRLRGDDVAERLLADWALDLEEARSHSDRSIASGRRPKLVHNIVFSMPKGTPPEKLHEAVRQFAAEKFGLEHRYAMALHTDQGAPHVHLVLKARSEQGVRLNIRKATLREWREDFARHLRAQGVEANATERAVRGAFEPRKLDGIFRANQRGESTHYRERVEASRKPETRSDDGVERLRRTRAAVVSGWLGLAERLSRAGQSRIADEVRRFAQSLPASVTEKQWLLLHAVKEREHDRLPLTLR